MRGLPEVRGREPDRLVQGSWDDRRDQQGGRGGRQGRCVPPREHERERRRLRGQGGAGLRRARPQGKIAPGKMAATIVHGARVLEVEGNFDASFELARGLAQRSRDPRELGQPLPPAGTEDVRVRDRGRARSRARRPLRPGRERRQHLEPLARLLRVPGRWDDPRAAEVVRVPGERRRAPRPRSPRRGAAHDRHRHPDREPRVVGPGDRGRLGVGGRDPGGDRPRHPGRVPTDRARGAVRRAGLGGERRGAAPARERGPAPRGGTVVCVLTVTGSRTRSGRRAAGPRRPRSRPRRTPSLPSSGCSVRLTATVPATSANLGPGSTASGSRSICATRSLSIRTPSPA